MKEITAYQSLDGGIFESKLNCLRDDLITELNNVMEMLIESDDSNDMDNENGFKLFSILFSKSAIDEKKIRHIIKQILEIENDTNE